MTSPAGVGVSLGDPVDRPKAGGRAQALDSELRRPGQLILMEIRGHSPHLGFHGGLLIFRSPHPRSSIVIPSLTSPNFTFPERR